MTVTPIKQVREMSAQLVDVETLLELSCRDENRYELLAGVVNMMSPAGSEHGHYASKLNARIQVHAENNQLGYTLAAETGFVLETDPDTVRAPDVSFVRAERVPAEGLPKGYFPGAPDLAVEVVSPNDRAADVQEKVQDWLTNGTQLLWLVEPASRTLTVYRQDGSAMVLQSKDTLDGENILPGFSYALDRLFF